MLWWEAVGLALKYRLWEGITGGLGLIFKSY